MPVPAGGLAYSTLYNEIADIRFNSSSGEITKIKHWLNAAEAEVWNAADWTFKRVPAATLTLTNGSRTPTMPADFGKVTRLYDDLGSPLAYLTASEWEEAFLGDTGSGRPCFYTVVNRQIYLGPTPDSAYAFKIAYRRRLAHYNNSDAVTAGAMSADTDYPLWDAQHHYILVPWAIARGARLEQDVAPEAYQADADRLLAAMVSELLPRQEGEIEVWGRC